VDACSEPEPHHCQRLRRLKIGASAVLLYL